VGKEEEKRFILDVLDKYKLDSKKPLFKMSIISNLA
jgi:hypothetical protein